MAIPLEAEAWTWYGVVMVVVIARFAARYLQFRSIKKFQWEDLCMGIVAMLYTAEVVLLIKSSVTPTNLIPPGEFDPEDQAKIALEIYGSKLIVALEMVYCATIWGCKGCLLLFYANLTYALPQNLWTKIVAVYAFTGYIVMVILYLGVWCRPFYNYWSVPAADPQCSTAEHHLIVNFVFNVSSDLLMMLIPLPMLIRTNLPPQKKIVVCAVFSLGVFCVLSAVLNKYYSFTSPYGSEWVYWYDREVSTAMIVANIPHLWVLLKKTFRLRSFISNQSEPRGSYSAPRRFFGDVADPLASSCHRKKLREMPSAQLEGVDIDQYMADIEGARLSLEAPSEKTGPAKLSNAWMHKKAAHYSSTSSDPGTLVASRSETIPSPVSAKTANAALSDTAISPDSPDIHHIAATTLQPDA